MVFNKGTPEEEEREMIVVDKEGYSIIEVTQDMVGTKISIPRKPSYFTVDQWKEIKQTKLD